MSVKIIIFYIFSILLTLFLIACFVGMVVYFIIYQKRLHSDENDGSDLKKGWIQTTGTFTGKSRNVVSYSRVGVKNEDYLEYEIRYLVGDKTYCGWYSFYPLPDSDFLEEGVSVSLRYSKKRPWKFEILEIFE